MKRLLLVSHQSPPLVSIATVRLLRFLRYLVSEGWETDLLTAREERYRSRERIESTQHLPGVRIFRESLLPEVLSRTHLEKVRVSSPFWRRVRSGRVVRFGARIVRDWIPFVTEPVGWRRAALIAGSRLIARNRYDCIYSSSGPLSCHRVAAALVERTGLPWVAEFRDAVVENPYYRKPTVLHRQYFLAHETSVVRRADRVVVTTRTHSELIRKRYGGSIRIHVVPNGFDPLEFEGMPSELPARFTLVHAGNLYGSRSLEPLLLGWKVWVRNRGRESPPPLFRFYGQAFNLDVAGFLRKHDLQDSVEVLGVRGHGEVLAALKRAHASVVIKSPEDRIHVPGKLYEGLGSGRPVFLLGPSSEASEIVERLRVGIWVDSIDPGVIAQGLERLADMKGRFHGDVSEFRADKLTGELARYLEEVSVEQAREISRPSPAKAILWG